MRNATVVSESLYILWAELWWTVLKKKQGLEVINMFVWTEWCVSTAPPHLLVQRDEMCMVPSSPWQFILIYLYNRRLPALHADNKVLPLFKVTGHSDIPTPELKWKAFSNLTANLLKLCSHQALLFSIKTCIWKKQQQQQHHSVWHCLFLVAVKAGRRWKAREQRRVFFTLLSVRCLSGRNCTGYTSTF